MDYYSLYDSMEPKYRTIYMLVMQDQFNYSCNDSYSIYKDIIPKTVSLYVDINPYAYRIVGAKNNRTFDFSDKEIIESKINFIYSNIIGRLQTNGDHTSKYGIPVLLMFFNMLNKLGISYVINYNVHYMKGTNNPIADRGDVYIQELCPNHIWEKIFDGTEETLCNFLFGDGSGVFSYDILYSIKYNSPEYIDEINKFSESISKNNMCNLFNY